MVDPVGLLNDPERPGRDGARTPMPWSDEPGAGFTTPDGRPWLPFGQLAGVNVAAQRADPGSPLNLTRDLVALRRSEEDLRAGSYEQVAIDEGLWAYRRGDGFLVALNLGPAPASVPADGTIAIATQRERDGEAIAGSLLLAPGEGAVLRLAQVSG